MIDLICCGAINWDINLFLERLPRTGEEVPVNEIQRVSGGTAANVAVAAARLLGEDRVAFIGALGDDGIGERQLDILSEEGVDHTGVLRVEGEESGQAYITIAADGGNEIHTYFGANLVLTRQRLRDPPRLRLIRGAKVAVIMDPPLETAEALASLCAESGAKVIWDPGVYAELGVEALSHILDNVDYFVLNHLEYENLVGTCEPSEVMEILGAWNPGLRAIIKRGEEGCILCSGGGEQAVVEGVPLERLGRTVVNTVGCGDAFIGAFAASKVEGSGDLEALRRGCAAGAFKATRKETRGGPVTGELDELLAEWESLS
ncbi:MAG: carbohydrate kinase family protein [Candidatus Bathyarchaeota archaeon]